MAATDQIWVIEGVQEMADAGFKDDATPEAHRIVLFSNDAAITNASAYADLTIIAANGCEAITLTKATWTAATAADPSVLVYNSGTGAHWDVTGAQATYGWAIVGVTSTKIYCAQNWALKTFGNGEDIDIQPLQLKFVMPLP